MCRPRGGWTQSPGANALAARTCNAQETDLADTATLSPGQVATYLVTGVVAAGPEGGLGTWQAVEDSPAINGVLVKEGARIMGAACP